MLRMLFWIYGRKIHDLGVIERPHAHNNQNNRKTIWEFKSPFPRHTKAKHNQQQQPANDSMSYVNCISVAFRFGDGLALWRKECAVLSIHSPNNKQTYRDDCWMAFNGMCV